jgi:hypothetical protein
LAALSEVTWPDFVDVGAGLRIAPISVIFLFSKLSIMQVESIDTHARRRLITIDHSETVAASAKGQELN